jgi:alkanesulfonate monooxygenase SsuD/methylene tetrahydromethanopterin reductase-like flavin-dependent oxidoreductase (luciferase family)
MASAHADEEVARREAASMIAFYGSVKSYGGIYAHEGFAAQAQAMQEAFKRGDIDAMVAAVTDDMIDAFAVAGTPEQVAAGLDRFRGAADEIVLFPPSFQVSPERIGENLALLTQHCAPATAAA